MFNAIFGGIFSNKPGCELSEKQLLENLSTQSCEAATQTKSAVGMRTGPGAAKVRRSYSAVVRSHMPKTEQDWVIVDPTEESDKLQFQSKKIDGTLIIKEESNNMETEGTHTLPETSTSSLTTLIYAHNMFDNEEGDIMLRSFFNRAEQETESQQWLITPEPCLTSVPSTQKSIIEKCPMENMLIEQPSAFMNSSITAKKNRINFE